MAPKEKKRALPGRQDAPTSQVATEDRILRKRTNASEILAPGSDRRTVEAFRYRWTRTMMSHPGLAPGTRLVGWALAQHIATTSLKDRQGRERPSGVAWPSVASLMSCVALSERQVQRAIADLIGGGWIERRIERGRNGSSTFTFSIPEKVPSTSPIPRDDKVTPVSPFDPGKGDISGAEKVTPMPPEYLRDNLKGCLTGTPLEISTDEIADQEFAAARALRARAQPDQTISTETEYEPMNDDPNDPTFDQDDDLQRPDPDWAPEGEPFHEVPLDPNDDPDDDEPLEPVEVDAPFDREPDIVRRFAQVVPDSIRTALRTFLETGVVTEALEVFLMENTERVSAFLGDDPYRLDERDAELWPVARIWQGAFDQAEARQREV